MIHVFSRVTLKPGCLAAYIEELKVTVPLVRAEAGCLRYEPSCDVDPETHDRFITFVESWESQAHLAAHLAAPHMKAYVQRVKDLREKTELHVMEPVL